jgi:hypothetical protein
MIALCRTVAGLLPSSLRRKINRLVDTIRRHFDCHPVTGRVLILFFFIRRGRLDNDLVTAIELNAVPGGGGQDLGSPGLSNCRSSSLVTL